MCPRKLAAAVVAAASLLTACHSIRFEVGDGPAGDVVHDRKTFFLDGLFVTQTVDVSQFCPHGAVAIREETTFIDGLLSVITLNIYSPRSSYYHCAAGSQ
jgi:hypothetical protein